MEKIIDMEIGSQAFTNDRNWQIIRRYKILKENFKPKYRYILKCTKCGSVKDISQGHFSEVIKCETCKYNKIIGTIVNHYKILEYIETKKGKAYYKVCCIKCGKESIRDMHSIKTTKFCSGCRGTTDNPAINILLNNYKSSAKKRGYTFDLTPEEFSNLLKSDCYYCGSKPTLRHFKVYGASKHGIDFEYNGIDRFDNSEGYTKENCVPCCSICNIMKSTLNYRDFKLHISKIFNHLNEGSTTISKESTSEANADGNGGNPNYLFKFRINSD